MQIPASVPAGPFTVTFSDGERTVTRTLTVEPPAQASVTVAPSAQIGGTLRVTGAGFVHPDGEQGSRIAIKIDDGAYSRLDSTLHQNRTIWWIAEADEYGNVDIDMPLPNGLTEDSAADGTSGSSPAFTAGTYTLRLLTGSLLAGDQSRTVQSGPFTVAAGQPDPVAPVVTAQPAGVSVDA
ncbi:MAG: hypothetical protein ACTMIR_07685, partial [Cellulomonadaceae bacterium]